LARKRFFMSIPRHPNNAFAIVETLDQFYVRDFVSLHEKLRIPSARARQNAAFEFRGVPLGPRWSLTDPFHCPQFHVATRRAGPFVFTGSAASRQPLRCRADLPVRLLRHAIEPGARLLSFENRQLLPESRYFECQRVARYEEGTNVRDEGKDARTHRSDLNRTAICSRPSDSQRNLLIFR
jgi:hypothetical protein